MRNLTILTLILYALAAPLHAQLTKIDRVNAFVTEGMQSYQIPGINDVPDTHPDLRRDYTDDELAAAAFKLKLLFPPGD
jgi:hypothetical protein